ncbi:hypothetical protein ACN6QM_06410, partial [Acinetobacter baumannii]
MSPIIHSLLDTDLYKFTMLQVVLHKFPQTHSVYHFRCRNLEDTVYPLVDILDAVSYTHLRAHETLLGIWGG